MQRKQTALGLLWSIVFVPQRKQRVYPILEEVIDLVCPRTIRSCWTGATLHLGYFRVTNSYLLPSQRTATFPVSWKRL